MWAPAASFVHMVIMGTCAGMEYGVFVGPSASTCAGSPGIAGALTPTQDSNQCNGGWARGGGNENSYRIHLCSSKCICFTQFAGTSVCDESKSQGSNIKESCIDRCMGDCNGGNCQFSGTGGGTTWLKLTEGPVTCDSQMPDDVYSCNTTGMVKSSTQAPTPALTSSLSPTTSIAATTPPTASLGRANGADLFGPSVFVLSLPTILFPLASLC